MVTLFLLAALDGVGVVIKANGKSKPYIGTNKAINRLSYRKRVFTPRPN